FRLRKKERKYRRKRRRREKRGGMAIKPLRRSEVSSSSATTSTSPLSATAASFPHSVKEIHFMSSIILDEPSEYDNLNYEEDGGAIRGEGTGLSDRDVEMGYMGSSTLLIPPGQHLR
uniref:Uncharacterized protein n=1 Tax=Pristionchus pacificus TaxID=54126 RepID=A0A2A6CRY2_PRIPA